jgi:DNA-binding NtrC family response regulator
MAAQPTVLVAGDRWGEREAMVEMLEANGFHAVVWEIGREVTAPEATAGLLVLQLDSWEDDASRLVAAIQRRPPIPVILIASHPEVEDAASRAGLETVGRLTEPVDPEEVLGMVRQVLYGERQELPAGRATGTFPFVAVSEAMQRVLHQVQRAAESDSPVLITGEAGTGKRPIAEAIHRNSRRRRTPFVTVNVATTAAAAVEKRLFGSGGNEAGQATQRTGDFVAASGGTLLIEEVSGLPKTTQAKVLWALEKQRITPVGDDREVAVDVRLIASTSRDLDELIAQDRFRAELYYRLNVIPIRVPPLRERREDIPGLVRHFLEEICAAEKLPPVSPEPELMRLLEDYDWPGNLRQLRNCLRSMVLLSRTDRLPAGASRFGASGTDVGADQPRPQKRLAELERMAMVEALEQHGGNRTSAAEALGISVRTLQRKLKKWSEEREETSS